MASKNKSIKKSASNKPVILVTNDDWITAPGIRSLVEAMSTLGEVVVVAPDSPQSGMGHAITIGKPLRLDKVEVHGEFLGWQCSGTPVDCVKLAVNKILHRKPDLCVSGINHGSNSSINVIIQVPCPLQWKVPLREFHPLDFLIPNTVWMLILPHANILQGLFHPTSCITVCLLRRC